MSRFGRSFFDASPLLTIPPQPVHQNLLGMAPHHHQPASCGSSIQSTGQESSWPPTSSYGRPAASRKRSRDDASDTLNDDPPAAPPPIEPIKESEEDWVYGEGMVLIKPGSGYVADASSQSGTWVEERAAEEAQRQAEAVAAAVAAHQVQDRPTLRSYKSQRLEQCAVASPGQQDAPANAPSPGPSTPGTSFVISTLSSDTVTQPVVDDFTLHLGIGWRRISDDEHIQAAARGWARYIENHYPLSSVSIRLESKGLQSYLIEASEGYFLFAEDLKQGRLVSQTVEGALVNLKSSPPNFDGAETMAAAATPKAPASPHYLSPVVTDVDMDMS